MGNMKTPGVYILEKNAFPNSVVEVATAVPAFIGYTEKADNKGTSLHNRPFRITSLGEFHQYFGDGPTAGHVRFSLSDLNPELPKSEEQLAAEAKEATRVAALTPDQRKTEAVSYTHLRAHETVLDLVCRLLLEKKKQQHQN